MKRKIYKGRIVAYIPKHDLDGTILWTVMKTAKNIYRCDATGRILSYNGISKRPIVLNEVKDTEQHKHPRVRIGKKLVRTDILIAKAVFSSLNFDKKDIGHFDGNPKNNKIENLYVDITLEEPTEEVQII